MEHGPALDKLDTILNEFRGKKGVMLAALHRVQEEYGYIPRGAIAPLGKALGMPPSMVYGSLSFYSEFRTEAPPETELAICLGPTCHQRDADHIKNIVEHAMGIDFHEMRTPDGLRARTPDGKYGTRILQCPGYCHVAPLAYVNGVNVSGAPLTGAAALAARITSGEFIGHTFAH